MSREQGGLGRRIAGSVTSGKRVRALLSDPKRVETTGWNCRPSAAILAAPNRLERRRSPMSESVPVCAPISYFACFDPGLGGFARISDLSRRDDPDIPGALSRAFHVDPLPNLSITRVRGLPERVAERSTGGGHLEGVC